jgi:hypothetical protein
MCTPWRDSVYAATPLQFIQAYHSETSCLKHIQSTGEHVTYDIICRCFNWVIKPYVNFILESVYVP